MKHIKRINEFKEEDFEVFMNKDLVKGAVEVPEKEMTRYLLHISDTKNRESIKRNGIIPKLPNKKWRMLHGDEFIKNQYWTKPALFATLFKDSIDVYDVKNIHNFVFPLIGLEDTIGMGIDDFIEANGLEFNLPDNIKKLKGTRNYGMAADGHYEQWAEDINIKYNKYMLKNAKYDIWLIDTEELLGVKWYKDVVYHDYNAILCYNKIPPRAIDLLAPNNKRMVKSIDEAEKFKPVISYDFDGCLHKSVKGLDPHDYYDYDSWEPFTNMMDKMREDAKEHKIVVVTARDQDMVSAVWKFIKKYDLPVEEVYATDNTPKYDILIKLGAIKHYDDNIKMKGPLHDIGIEFEHVDPIKGTSQLYEGKSMAILPGHTRFEISFTNTQFYISDNTLTAFVNGLRKIDPELDYQDWRNGVIGKSKVIYIDSASLSQNDIRQETNKFIQKYDHLQMNVAVNGRK